LQKDSKDQFSTHHEWLPFLIYPQSTGPGLECIVKAGQKMYSAVIVFLFVSNGFNTNWQVEVHTSSLFVYRELYQRFGQKFTQMLTRLQKVY